MQPMRHLACVAFTVLCLLLAPACFAQTPAEPPIQCPTFPGASPPVQCNYTEGSFTDVNNGARCPQPACSCKQLPPQPAAGPVSSTVEFVNRNIQLPSQPGTPPADCPAEFHHCIPRGVDRQKRTQVLKCNDDALGDFEICATYNPTTLSVTFYYYDEAADTCNTRYPVNPAKIASVALSSPAAAPGVNQDPIDPVCSYYKVNYTQYLAAFNTVSLKTGSATTAAPLALPANNTWPVPRARLANSNSPGAAIAPSGPVTVGACVKACNCLLPRPANFPHYWCVQKNKNYEPVADGKLPAFPYQELDVAQRNMTIRHAGPDAMNPGACNRISKVLSAAEVAANNVIIHKGPMISLPNQPEEYPMLNTPAPGQAEGPLPTYDMTDPGYYTMEVVIFCSGTRNGHQALIYVMAEGETCPLPDGLAADTSVKCTFEFNSMMPAFVIPMTCSASKAEGDPSAAAASAGRKMLDAVQWSL